MSKAKIAIVGMEALFGADEGLDAFDRTIFDNAENAPIFSTEDPQDTAKKPKSEIKEGYLRLLNGTKPLSASSILRTVVEGALRDTLSKAADNRLSDMALIVISDNEMSDLQIGSKLSLTASSLPLALQRSQDLLSGQEVIGAIICALHFEDRDDDNKEPRFHNGLSVGEGAGAVLLKRAEQAIQDQDRIYAIIDAMVLDRDSKLEQEDLAKKVTEVCRRTLDIVGVGPTEIGYLEIMGKGIQEDSGEMKGLAEAYRVKGDLTCALGYTRANGGKTSPVSCIASLIKTALCLYGRHIPATPQWTGAEKMELEDDSPFYVATESRPWFVDATDERRIAAIISVGPAEIAHLILSEDVALEHRPNRYLALVSPYCFPLAGEDQADLARQLETLQKAIDATSSLPSLARENLEAFERQTVAPYALMIAGYNQKEISEDIQFMLKGIPAAFQEGADLKTPKGSYFTPKPLGVNGKVTFVYPGIGSAYIGLGQEIFHLFPEAYTEAYKRTPKPGEYIRERVLYPRTRHLLTSKQILEMEVQMRDDIMTLGEAGTCFSGIFTILLRDIFKVKPDCALGYSMGEPTMMASLGVWANPEELTDRVGKSITFQERLNGALTAVWDYWGLDRAGPTEKVWGCYGLRASPEAVREAINDEERVFLTIINTPEEVVISGDPESCFRVVGKIGCKFYPLNLGLAIHCDPARVEYDRMVELYTLAINETTDIKFYSSSCYKSIPIRSKAVAHSIARALTETVDFPRLVNQAYDDGARIFIELGSRKFCCHMIEKILKGRDHIALPINVKGTKDHTSFVRVLSRLVSHRVPVDLSPLF